MNKVPLTLQGGVQSEASFRDPAGFVYRDEKGVVLRQVNPAGAEDYELLMNSGLYAELASKGWLVSHVQKKKTAEGGHVTLQPQAIPVISYPFEWSFSQLRDAALLTLKIQKRALSHGLSLKDASAYNIQFLEGRPILIDTLSFERYKEGEPWKAYRQFCQHFLAPLALMAHVDVALLQTARIYLDGIPLGLAAKLLPRSARLRTGLLLHLFWHARAQKANEHVHIKQAVRVGMRQQLAIIDSLERTIRKLKPKAYETEWGDYYTNTNYTPAAADKKAKLIREMVRSLKAQTVLDFGGNDGRYSRALHKEGVFTVCADIDPIAVEANYRLVKKQKETLMLPLLVDFTNPGGAMGWSNQERTPIHERLQVDAVLALAVIHHLAISNNLPFDRIAKYFHALAPYLIIEFVPKADSQVQKLLATREDIFPDYTEDGFERAFGPYYTITQSQKIAGSKRTLYVMRRKRDA